MKIVFFGSNNDLSLLPLQALMASSYYVVAVVTERTSSKHEISLIPVGKADDIASVALQNGIELMTLSDHVSTLEPRIKALDPDVIIVSCFPKKIPASILTLSHMVSLNIHPSKLPAYRGPNPVFWQIRDDKKEISVSIHEMNEYFDRGDILDQRNLEIYSMWNMYQLNQSIAKKSAQLLIQTLDNIHQRIRFARPQEHQVATYHSFPQLVDFQISTSWHAERVFRFMKITDGLTCYYPVFFKEREFKLLKAIDYHPLKSAEFSIKHNQLTLPCHKGHVIAEFLTH